jgi:hypothetical protein
VRLFAWTGPGLVTNSRLGSSREGSGLMRTEGLDASQGIRSEARHLTAARQRLDSKGRATWRLLIRWLGGLDATVHVWSERWFRVRSSLKVSNGWEV